MPIAPGTKIGNYEIQASLGEGGMGAVYQAHDPTLQRTVAIKILAKQDEDASARLLQEARSASALNHPHICTIHEVGEHEGQAFIVMEHVEGKPLSALIPADGLPPESVIRYGTQIADALAHAHERGIVHRDLKPANVVVTPERRAKVLDFGLAKRVSGQELTDATTRTELSMTRPGTLVGTLPYMAPERLRGERADVGSDVWALGVMLHEMLTGAQPFAGQTTFELSSAILSRPATPLPGTVPVELRAVVQRCLSKERAARYQHAGELLAALEVIHAGAVLASWEAWKYVLSRRPVRTGAAAVGAVAVVVGALVGLNVSSPGGARIQSIAVLPLVNLTGDPDQEYFADGIHEALITDLAKLGSALRVTARPSVLGYKDAHRPLSEIARELGVDVVMTGSVMRAGDRVQITGQLIDGVTEEHLWAERYERELQNVLTVQNEIVAAIAREIELTLTPEAEGRLATARPVDPEAYEAYLRGRSYLELFTPPDLETAQQYFELALKEDPNYALAHAGISAVWARRVVAAVVPAREAAAGWKEAAERAVELDDTLAEAHGQLAQAMTWVDWDWEGAEAEYQRAIALNPSYAEARVFYSHFLTAMGRAEEAAPQIERALELDPLVAFNHAMHGVQLTFADRDEDAYGAFQEAFRMNPNLGFAGGQIASLLARQGRYEEALDATREFHAGRGNTAAVDALTQGAAEGGFEGAMLRLAEVQAARPDATRIRPFNMAVGFANAGQADQTFEWLERAIEARDHDMVYLAVNPAFRTEVVRGDPRFNALLRRMNLPQWRSP